MSAKHTPGPWVVGRVYRTPAVGMHGWHESRVQYDDEPEARLAFEVARRGAVRVRLFHWEGRRLVLVAKAEGR